MPTNNLYVISRDSSLSSNPNVPSLMVQRGSDGVFAITGGSPGCDRNLADGKWYGYYYGSQGNGPDGTTVLSTYTFNSDWMLI